MDKRRIGSEQLAGVEDGDFQSASLVLDQAARKIGRPKGNAGYGTALETRQCHERSVLVEKPAAIWNADLDQAVAVTNKVPWPLGSL